MKLITTADVDVLYLNCAVFGDSGCGKTTSLQTLPDSTFVLTGERSTIPLRKKNFNAARFRTWEDLQLAVYCFMAPHKIPELFVDARDAEDWTKLVNDSTWFALDSLSEASTCCVRYIVTVLRKALVLERTGGKKDRPDSIYEELMTQEDWGLYRSKMLGLLKSLADLPIHKVVTCRAGWRKDKQGYDTFRTFGISGQAALEAPAYFDLVVSMESIDVEGGTKRVWRTFNDGKVVAKDSSGKLDPFEDTNWQAVAKKILS